MSRGFAALGVGLAAIVGIATSYVTFQPELQRQQEEREGTFQVHHAQSSQSTDDAISKAIISDFQEAKQQAMDTSRSGPAWKLRQMLFGKKPSHPDNEQAAAEKSALPKGGEEEKKGS
ncbi:hypothetical protein LTR85_006516 [Meristemomyces frigidus]|nr:hypothetical protein LTR85_006516 [Meristemomyces frigidus]